MAQGVNDPACLCGGDGLISGPEQWVQLPAALLQLWCRLQMQLGFSP